MLAAETTLAVILGAMEWPEYPQLEVSGAFEKSAEGIKRYLESDAGLKLPVENVLDLFDDPRPPAALGLDILNFVKERRLELRNRNRKVTDLIIYFVGHGDFVGEKDAYQLFIRFTSKEAPRLTSFSINEIAEVLRVSAIDLRKYLIIDACYAAGAARAFGSSPGKAMHEQMTDTLPTKGLAILCSSSRKRRSKAMSGEKHTMFTGSLLRLLATGDASRESGFTLRDIAALTQQMIRDKYSDVAVPPEVHSPVQHQGDVADIPIFPNPSADAVESSAPQGEAIDHRSTRRSIADREADIALILSIKPRRVHCGDNVKFTITLRNDGKTHLRHFFIRHDAKLVAEPFDLPAGKGRRFAFWKNYDSGGNYTETVKATCFTEENDRVEKETEAILKVRKRSVRRRTPRTVSPTPEPPIGGHFVRPRIPNRPLESPELILPSLLGKDYSWLDDHQQKRAPVDPLEAPKLNLSAAKIGAKAALEWTPIVGACSYILEKSTTKYFLFPSITFDGTATRFELEPKSRRPSIAWPQLSVGSGILGQETYGALKAPYLYRSETGFTWTTVEGADRYVLQESDTEAFLKPQDVYAGPETSLSYTEWSSLSLHTSVGGSLGLKLPRLERTSFPLGTHLRVRAEVGSLVDVALSLGMPSIVSPWSNVVSGELPQYYRVKAKARAGDPDSDWSNVVIVV